MAVNYYKVNVMSHCVTGTQETLFWILIIKTSFHQKVNKSKIEWGTLREEVRYYDMSKLSNVKIPGYDESGTRKEWGKRILVR